MAIKYDNVIVFGPTGAVGGAVALEASKRGAKVWLAMRSPDKVIDGISEDEEQQGTFERIQADLSDPDSVARAVEKSGAKAAFVYRVMTPDHLKSSLVAMKSAGIEYVVFLSSLYVWEGQALRDIPASDFISYMHAQIEINLEDVGIAHTALRPGAFASKPFHQDLDTSKTPWEAQVLHGDITDDLISPMDVGRVGGAVLVERPSASAKQAIYLCGPQLMTRDEQWETVKQVTGREIVVAHLSRDEKVEQLKALELPPPLVVDLIKGADERGETKIYPEPLYSQGLGNIKKYSGYEPTEFADYVATLKFH